MGLCQKFEMGLALEKQTDCVHKKGRSVSVAHHIKRNINISDLGEKNFDKIQHSFVILKKILVKR